MRHQRVIISAKPEGQQLCQGRPMFSSIQIRGYRGFAEFEMSNLGRVNLLVGKNNSGKTSALEGLYLLASRGTPYSVWNVLWRRGERLYDRTPENYPQAAVCHLFHGHESAPNTKFTLTAQNSTPMRQLAFSIGEIADDKQKKEITRGGIPVPLRLGLHIKGTPSPTVETIPLSRTAGMSSETLSIGTGRRSRTEDVGADMPTRFITTESVSSDDLAEIWNQIQLTPYEGRVHRALRLLDTNIEAIRPETIRGPYYGGSDRGGFSVKIKGVERPIPIGSMGDGIWRIMAMAISLAQCKDGVLLIDEIDTGLHYSVMTDMWKFIHGAAVELNVQVFASTHSNDCVKSLAEFCFEDPEAAKEVILHRIEQGKKNSIRYSAKELEIAAEKHIEVR